MRRRFLLPLLLSAPAYADPAAPPPPSAPVPPDEQPKGCDACAEWSQPRAPFRVHGDSFYVGTAGLSAMVVRTADGVVLLDGTLPESAAVIVANLATLGMSITDVRWILTSHAHYDHAGGIAALQRQSGATVVTTEAAAAALRAGNVLPDDPQAGYGGDTMSFPPVTGPIRTVRDGEVLEAGGVRFTPVPTPGHTPGGASWAWESCEDRCVTVLYADSLNPVSADGFRFSDHPALLQQFGASIDRLRDLRCEILIPVHPSFGSVFEDAARAERVGGRAFTHPRACSRYADDAAERLKQRLKQEAG